MQDNQMPPRNQFESTHAEHGSSVQKLTVVLPEDARGYLRWVNGMSLGLAFAIVLSLGAGMFAFAVETQEERRVYLTGRCEGFIEQLAFEKTPVNPSYLSIICQPRDK